MNNDDGPIVIGPRLGELSAIALFAQVDNQGLLLERDESLVSIVVTAALHERHSKRLK